MAAIFGCNAIHKVWLPHRREVVRIVDLHQARKQGIHRDQPPVCIKMHVVDIQWTREVCCTRHVHRVVHIGRLGVVCCQLLGVAKNQHLVQAGDGQSIGLRIFCHPHRLFKIAGQLTERLLVLGRKKYHLARLISRQSNTTPQSMQQSRNLWRVGATEGRWWFLVHL